MSDEQRAEFESADEMPDDAREALGHLLLVLADNKRLLGIRYADWILGAPALEAGISCSAMAQDEWGHGRILYAMLKDFDRRPERLEHEREASEYRNAESLDGPIESWPGLLALNLLLDSALTVQFEALSESRFQPIHYKVAKLLDEERFHFAHGRAWTVRLGGTAEGREALAAAFAPVWAVCLRWFGPDDDPVGSVLARSGVTDADPAALRSRWLARVGPSVSEAGLELGERTSDGWRSREAATWDGWRPETRRGSDGGPDPDTLARVRGDRNRALLMD